MFARNQVWQIAALLRVGAPAADLIDAEIGVGALAEADRSRSARNFLHRDDMFEITETEPAEFFLASDAMKAERAPFGPESTGTHVGHVDFCGDRGDPIDGAQIERPRCREKGSQS